MSHRASRALIALVASAHAAFFIAYQRPDWSTQWTDQNGYLLLGRVLAATGRFTRYVNTPDYVPEVIRTPLYPAFVAMLDAIFGEHHLVIAIAQAGLFVLTCLLVHGIARRVASDRVAVAAGLVVALYPPLPYYAALVLTETLTTCLVTAAVASWLTADRRRSTKLAVGSGVLLAAAALTRPTFALLPIFFAAAPLFVGDGRSERARNAAIMLAAYAIAIAPWIGYNAIYFRTLTFSPAGGPGRQLFEGTWQMEFPGRIETELTSLADDITNRDELDSRIRKLAADSGLDAEPMLRYAHQHQDIQRMWDAPTEPHARAQARIDADREYWRVAVDNIRRHPLRHFWRRAWRGSFLLWATEIPIRYSDINRLPSSLIRMMWLAQVSLIGVAAWGVVVLIRKNARVEAYVSAALVLYVTAVHAPLYSEARYSLPAKPVVLLLATLGVAGWRGDGAGQRVDGLPPSQSHA